MGMSIGMEAFGRTSYLARFLVGSCDNSFFCRLSWSDNAVWLDIDESEDKPSDVSVAIDDAIEDRDSFGLASPSPPDKVCKCFDGLELMLTFQ